MLTAEKLSDAITVWKSSNVPSEIDYLQNTLPVVDDTREDYQVIFQCGFYPQADAKTMLEFWLTADGAVAVGVERLQRVAKRAHLQNSHDGFAGGFEPRKINVQQVLNICDLARNGALEIVAYGSFGRLVCCGINVPDSVTDMPDISRMSNVQTMLASTKFYSATRLSYSGW
jgi:hypothetical protein